MNRWLLNLARVIGYVGAIVYATLFAARWEQRTTRLEESSARIEAKVDKLSADTIQRGEWNRSRRADDLRNRKLWTALHRKQDAEDLPE